MRTSLIFVLLSISFNSLSQPRYNGPLLDTLEQISATNTPSRHFAKLYYRAIKMTNKYADQQPDSVKNFIFGFESVFAPAFFKSYEDFVSRRPQSFSWEQYYIDTSLNELQYEFMGMNAHINGDMWVALRTKYRYDTLRKYKKALLDFQRALNSLFDSIYTTTKQYERLRHLHAFTLGLDKINGRRMVLHWRKRQVKLALLYYSNPLRCDRLWARVQKKKLRWDKFARRNLR